MRNLLIGIGFLISSFSVQAQPLGNGNQSQRSGDLRTDYLRTLAQMGIPTTDLSSLALSIRLFILQLNNQNNANPSEAELVLRYKDWIDALNANNNQSNANQVPVCEDGAQGNNNDPTEFPRADLNNLDNFRTSLEQVNATPATAADDLDAVVKGLASKGNPNSRSGNLNSNHNHAPHVPALTPYAATLEEEIVANVTFWSAFWYHVLNHQPLPLEWNFAGGGFLF